MQLNFEQPEFSKNLFPGYIHRHPNIGTNKITGNFPSKFFVTKIHREFYAVPMHIPLPYLMTWYFSCEFSHDCVASKTT